MSEEWKIVQHEGPRVWQVSNTIFPSNCYICESRDPSGCLLIDPGLNAAVIEAALQAIGLKPMAVLCTHGHFDHAGSARHFEREYGCSVYLHEADQKALNASNFLLMAFNIPARVELPAKISFLKSSIHVGDDVIKVHHTPGHTPGSCIFEVGQALFTGDTLYANGVGLSRLPGEDQHALRQSIRHMINVLPHDAIAHPGHGQSARLEWIIKHNIGLQSFLEEPQNSRAS